MEMGVARLHTTEEEPGGISPKTKYNFNGRILPKEKESGEDTSHHLKVRRTTFPESQGDGMHSTFFGVPSSSSRGRK